MSLPGAPPIDDQLSERLNSAVRARGPGYQPRTRHRQSGGTPRFTNRLILETSPYLLQHAHNPVNWFPWGDEAFEVAKQLDRPVLLSIGYSTCHWCHVMEEESFEDVEIAERLNSLFVPIKVDREERPDVDAIYMSAVQAMTGGGGWPMTVALDPARRPYFGGTYFPPRAGVRGARVGFDALLLRLAEVYRDEREVLETNAQALVSAIRESLVPTPLAGIPPVDAIPALAHALARRFDPEFGGFGGAPKFPRPAVFDFLLRYHDRTADPSALDMVVRSLQGICRGGIHDQIGGGFHRYSTDDAWVVPHFEKMLYDNAQLASTLTDAWRASHEPELARAAHRTLNYVAREMLAPEGAFWSATDADSEGEEGTFFVWTEEEITKVLGPALAPLALRCFGVQPGGNFEGKSILVEALDPRAAAPSLGLDPEEAAARLEEAKSKLYQARGERPHPFLDDKILVEWNGQMISAFARAAFVFKEPKYLGLARTARTFLATNLERDGRLFRSYRGRPQHAAVLEDYVFSVAAELDLFEVTGEPEYLDRALALHAAQETYYLDPADGLFTSAGRDVAGLISPEKSGYDGAQPAGNSIAALNAVRLYQLTQETRFREIAGRILTGLGASLTQAAMGAPKLMCALEAYLDEPWEILIVRPAGSSAEELLDVVRRHPRSNGFCLEVEEGPRQEALAQRVPSVSGKKPLSGRPTAYVCRFGACQAPTPDPAVLREQLSARRPLGSFAPLAPRRR
ncbi:MAG: thioredoxin domain-containing protein [Myxococcota bacterium]